MIRDGQVVCDGCQKVITRLVVASTDGWERMHNLCPDCFAEARKRSVPRG